MTRSVETLVIGAGISGLVRAHALGPDADVVVVDAATRAGGRIETAVVDDPGLRYERGPEALAAGSEHVVALAERIGVATRSVPARARYVVVGGRLVAVPMSPPTLLRSPLMSWRGKLRLLTEPLRTSRRCLDGSIADFARHRLGQEALDVLVDPMVSGVFAGDPEQLSVRACLPRLVAGIEQHGSLFGALRHRPAGVERVGLWKPRGGMQALVDGLAGALGDRFRLSCPVTSIERAGAHYVVRGVDGPAFDAERVVLALPLAASRRLLRGPAPDAAAALDDMTAENIVAVIHAHRRADVGHSLDGFGYLAPAREGLTHLGTLFSSSIDPEGVADGLVVLRTLLGGARQRDLIDLADDALLALVEREVGPLLDLATTPVWSAVDRYPVALPRFDLAHPRRLERMRGALPPGLDVLGSFTEGAGLSSLVEVALRARAPAVV